MPTIEEKKDAKQLAMARQEEEEQALLKEKMDNAGLSFENHELPDDDVVVKKSFIESLRGMWPWSDEYYEAEAAEEEMDNLKAIRVERARAEDMLAMTKVGDHEKALDIMMSETNNDFFFFNKLMTKWNEEGKWEYDEPELNPFGVLEAQQRRNRVRRAFRATYTLLSGDQENAMAGAMAAMNKSNQPQEESLDCPWKGKSKTGEFLICRNQRMVHPGEGKSGRLQCCTYHEVNCCNPEHTEPVKIKTPNDAALCTECYMLKKPGVSMPNLQQATAPGVGPSIAAMMAGNQPGGEENKEDPDGGLTELSVCSWKASKKEKHLRTWTCSNTVIRNLSTGALHTVCGWHAKKCMMSHTGGTSTAIDVPNEYGLCTMHHTSVYGAPPEEYEIPYPGMIVKKGKNAWMKEGHHWASPRYEPFYPRDAEEYEEPDPPDDFIQMIMHQAKIAAWKRRKRLQGKKMATIIQSYWRMWKVEFAYKHLKFDIRKKKRLEATILMQCAGRRRMAVNLVHRIRKQRTWAAVFVQRHYRGFRTRIHVRDEKACRRIQKFFHSIRIFKFKDAVIMMVQLKKLSRRRHGNALEIQRIFRGYMVRLQFFQAKLWDWIRNRSARVITREIRAYGAKVVESKKVVFVVPDMNWAYSQCRKRLAKMIYKLWMERKNRGEFIRYLTKQTQFVQRHVRAFIARRGVNKMRFLHKEMRKWIQPKYALEFTNRFFESHVFWLNNDEKRYEKKDPPPPPEPTWLIRDYLPDKVKEEIEVSNEDFVIAMKAWYKNKAIPLLSSEMDSLQGVFSNPATSKVEIARVEDYIMLSDLPCRRHGRTLCGKCIFLGPCSVDKCRCTHYYPNDLKEEHYGAKATSICRDCFHAADAHRKCPLQLEEANEPRTMLSLMRAEREPDMSMPSEVVGVDFDDIIVPPEDPDDIQLRRDNAALKKNQDWFRYQTEYRMSTLALMIAYLEEKGEDVAELTEYWGQHNLRTVGDLKVDERGNPLKNDDKANVNVDIYPVPPRAQDVTLDQFWEESAKNPNKSKRDYDERFEHNMPMPVVVSDKDGQNDITYTFEGSKVYLNILIQIIDIGEGKVPGAIVHYDNPDFLRLVMNHIQVFERHWRKMVADVRKGELNRNVKVDQNAKSMYAALALPRPKLATTLDQAFRDLGFHKKVLGKDVETGQFAEKYRHEEVDPHQRRLSLPMTPGSVLVGEEERDIELRGQLRSRGPMSRSGEYVPGQGRERAKSRSRSPSPIRGRSSSPGLGSRGGSRGGGGSRRLKKKSYKELLVMVGDSMKTAVDEVDALHAESRSRGPSRRTRGDGRRGSETDIVREAKNAELHSLNAELETEPRTGYHLAIEIDGDRFICPFPACGKSFKSKDAAFRHLPIHEQKIRLFAPTALPDSHLNFYWPKHPPWNKESQFNEVITPPGNYACEEEGCKASFTTKQKLEKHIQREHQKIQIDSTDFPVTWFKPQGDALCVPPYDAPNDIPIKYCRDHVNPSPYCMLCIALEKNKGPKPPYRFFDAMGIDFKEKEEANRVRYAESGKKRRGKRYARPLPEKYRPNTGKQAEVITLNAEDRGKVVSFTKMVGVQSITKLGYVASMVVDKTTKCYVAIRPLLNHSDAAALGVSVPRDFDKQYEVRFMPDENENLEEYCEWVPVGNVLGVYPLLHTEKKEFRNLLKSKGVSTRSYFVRQLPEDFDEEGGKRLA